MPEKPANQDLSQAFPGIDSTSLENIYEGYMDAMLAALGRPVTFWLPPAQTPPTTNPDQFNPMLGGRDPRLGPVSEQTGRNVEPIYVVYTAHVVHGPMQISEENPFELEEGQVRLTTVVGSQVDIEDAIEVEIDGIKYDKMAKDDRLIGFSSTKYIISFWTKKSGD